MATSPSHRLSVLLRDLHALRVRRNVQLAALLLGWGVGAGLLLLLLSCWLDAWLRLPAWGRWGALAAVSLTLAATLALSVARAVRRAADQALAALAEQAQPEAGNAIINAVQLHESGTAGAGLIEAILEEAPGARPSAVRVSATYPRVWRVALAYALPSVALLAVLTGLVGGERLSVSLRRVVCPWAAIQPYAETVIVSVTPASATTVRRGSPLTVEVRVSGVVPELATLEWRAEEGGERVEMTPEPGQTGVFACELPPLFAPLSFRVRANDAESGWHEVSVENPPGLSNWECQVTPPSYAGLPAVTFSAASETREALVGSRLVFAGAASRPVSRASLLSGDDVLATCEGAEPFTTFRCRVEAPASGVLAVALTTPDGLESRQPVPISVTADLPPSVSLLDTAMQHRVRHGEHITIQFGARDDYGLRGVTLEQLLPENRTADIAEALPEASQRRQFQGRFVVDTATFDPRGGALRFRVCAEDLAPSNARRPGLSPVITVQFLSAEETARREREKAGAAARTLEQLLARQRNALKGTNEAMRRTAAGAAPTDSQIGSMSQEQRQIREMALGILEHREMLGIVGDTLAGLSNLEMPQAIVAIDALRQAPPTGMLAALQQVADIQTRIVACLSSMDGKVLASEEKHRARMDCFERLQRLVKDQSLLIRQTGEASGRKDADLEGLSRCQVSLARAILAFNDAALRSAEEYAGDDFSVQLRKALEAIDQGKSYDHALAASELLDEETPAAAVDEQKQALKGLAAAYTILNQWRISQAARTVAAAKETIEEVREVLAGLEKTQARIAEVARELQRRKPPEDDPGLKDDMEKMAAEHEKMLDLLEKCANDLYQFPDLPICNELNSKMKEIFEDVMQAKDSEKLKAVEIAVQKEDAILDLIRKTTERVDDVEMWLPDVPDHFVWNMESFDADEFPEMPLVELPEELQDIVGELLEQDSDIDAASQDTTGNNMVADMEMGWAVMDGPMPSFSAKGKSGNTRPNDNEMTGRSGSGREGMSNGELVENHVKGYEGRKTKARKTNDPYQKGQVTEDKDSTMDARSTGGGKLGGDSESIGMFGNAQRRDLHRGAHGRTPRQLRQETDVLFAKARLLYANPGSLGEAAHHLSVVGRNPPDLKSFESIRKKVVRRLSDTVIEMQEGTVLPMPVDPVTKQTAGAGDQRQGERVSDEYRPQLNSYFKSLGQ